MKGLDTIWNRTTDGGDSTVQTDGKRVFKLYSPNLKKTDLELYQKIQTSVSDKVLDIVLSDGLHISGLDKEIINISVNFLNNSSDLLEYCDIREKKKGYVTELDFVKGKTFGSGLIKNTLGVQELYEKVNNYIKVQTGTNLDLIYSWQIYSQIHPANIKIAKIEDGTIQLIVTDICKDIEQFVRKNNVQGHHV